ncbi:SMI1/KNR4 family protein [Variovorax atrisoli]|uniref:SMI1/KNR4 family protein n=1 Tax=Variovorax atrisoli TaxID=3394203 RepID=UPI0003800BF2|nr:SMI1/KNR4 family protein [Variovorax paradoxus]
MPTPKSVARYPVVLSWRSAGSASLDDAPGLELLWKTWNDQLSSMESVASGRGWQIEPLAFGAPVSGKTLNALDAKLMRRTGRPLPAQLRWLLTRASSCAFGWRTSAEDEPDGKFAACYAGGAGALWDVEQIDPTGQALSSWVDGWVEDLRENEEDAEATAMQALWDRHLPFLHLPNGDLLVLDLSSDDPARQPVRYFSHERDGLHGHVLAADLFEFLSGWMALGCVGSTWHCWDLFTADEGPERVRLDTAGPAAERWRMWLADDPAFAPEGGVMRPKPVRASTSADFALLEAAVKGDIRAAETAIAAGARLDCADLDDHYNDENTAVVLAAKRDDLAMLECLLRHGASLAPHKLPLVAAMTTAQAPTLLWLIRAGARIDPWPEERFAALHRLLDAEQLSDGEYFAVLDAMLAAGANPNVGWDTASSGASTTMLMRTGPMSQARLLAAGADPHMRDLQGRTAMHHARSPEQIKLLADHGLDANDFSRPPPGDTGTTPLQDVLGEWSETAPAEAVQAFLSAEADPALTDSLGNNAWAYCRHLTCAQLLAKHLPFDPAWRNARGQTCLHFAVEQGQRLYVHSITLWPQLVRWGLEIDAQDADGNTALHLMAGYVDSEHDLPSVQQLIDMGASWEVRNHVGKTPRDLLKKKYRTSAGALRKR